MANGATSTMRFTITAVDRATAVILRLNNTLAKLNTPFARLNKSSQQFARATGWDKVTTKLGNVWRAAQRVSEQFVRIAGSLAAITGVGTLAGLAAIIVQFGKLGFEVARTSNVLGISTTTLQQWRNAAIASGLSAEDATQALQAMGTTLEDAVFGRNQQALVLMNRLGISLNRTRDGAIDSSRALVDLARALADPRFKGNRQAQALVANAFGAGNLLPLLLQGEDAVKKALGEGAVMNPAQVAAAEKFGIAMARTQLAVNGLKIAIGNELLPVLTPMIEKFNAWITANRGEIGAKTKEFIEWLADRLPKIADSIGRVVDSLGGWEGAAKAFGVVMAVSVLAPLASFAASITTLTVSLIPALAKTLIGLGTLLPGVAAASAGASAGVAAGLSLAALSSVGLAAGLGLGAGYGLHKATEGTRFNDAIGGGVASMLAFFGNSTARAAIEQRNRQRGAARNNPGNIRYPGQSTFRSFETPQAGTDAMAKQLLRYGNGQFSGKPINTVRDIVSTWAPASDGNNVDAYVGHVSQLTGFDPSKKLDVSDRRVLSALVQAMAAHEGSGTAVTKQMADRAAATATGQAVDVKIVATPGLSATVTTGGRSRTTTAMPSLDTP